VALRMTTGCGGRRWIKCQSAEFIAPPLNRDVRLASRTEGARRGA